MSQSIDTRADDPLNRREAGGQLRGFRPEYNIMKMEHLPPVMEEVWAAGRLREPMLKKTALAGLDERVVEYPLALQALIEAAGNPFLQVLDVGCVLNNPIIKDYVAQLVEMIWFINPSLETLAYESNMTYVLSDIRKVRLPQTLSFDLVTCLSTLEHVGMDNTRYGGAEAEFEGLIEDPQRYAIQGLRSISRFVKVGGRLLVSVPFGPFEYLYMYKQSERPIYYTFDEPRFMEMVACLDNFEITLVVYKVVPGVGWVKTTLDDDENMLKHADKCAAAGGVAFIDAVRKF
ncbi:MAG: hypothetical protein VCD00_03945 [Candidatus Hydrogenedentota bacterium]